MSSAFVGVTIHASGSGFDGNGVLYRSGNCRCIFFSAAVFETNTTFFTRGSATIFWRTVHSCFAVAVVWK